MAATESLMEGGQATYEKNGEKVNFELQPKNIGLTKEQLESYRNDPFWKPVRTVLFAVFWLSWLLMFAAAIAIVVLSPKCAEKEQPIWYQTQVSYQIMLPSFRDTDGDGVGDFNGVTEKLDLLRKVGVTTIHLSPVAQIDKDLLFDTHAITDHSKIDGRFGTEEDLKNLINVAHDKDMKVIIDFPISTVSKKHTWFVNGETEHFATVTPAKKFYADKIFFDWPGKNATKYLGVPDQEHPVLDLFSENSRKPIVNAIQFYTTMGVDGFDMGNVRDIAGVKLLELPEEGQGLGKAQNIIRMLAAIGRDVTDSAPELKGKDLLFITTLDATRDKRPMTNENRLYHVVDNSYTMFKNEDCLKENIAVCLENRFNKLKTVTDQFAQYWQFESLHDGRLTDRFDPESAALLTMVQLCMPGAISIRYGQELGIGSIGLSKQNSAMRWNSEANFGFSAGKLHDGIETAKNGSTFDDQYSAENSLLKVVQKLAKLRQRDEVFSLGTAQMATENEVLGLGRHASLSNSTATGHAYLGLFNFGSGETVVKFTDFKQVMPKEEYNSGEIVVVTERLQDFRPRQKIDFSSSLTLPAKQGILVKF